MRDSFTVTGTLTNARTVTLDEGLPLAPTRVRVVVEPLSSPPTRPYHDVVAEIRARQERRGHQPPSRAEVDAALEQERASWDG
jgi:hypothetical protein